MKEILILFFLTFFAVLDLSKRRIPNEFIILFALAGVFISGSDFILRFIISLIVFIGIYIFIPLKFRIGGADLKITAVLVGICGVWYTAYCLLFASGIVLILNIPNKVKNNIPIAAYILEGFLCAELLRL